MEHPRVLIFKLLLRIKQHFDGNRASRFQIALAAAFFALLAWMAGVLAGAVAAFFVVFITPDGPNRGWPAVYTLVGITLAVGIMGSLQAWRMYREKAAALEP